MSRLARFCAKKCNNLSCDVALSRYSKVLHSRSRSVLAVTFTLGITQKCQFGYGASSFVGQNLLNLMPKIIIHILLTNIMLG